MAYGLEDTLHEHIGESIREDQPRFTLYEAVHLIEEHFPHFTTVGVDAELQSYYGCCHEQKVHERCERNGHDPDVPAAGGEGPDQISPEEEAPEDD